MQSVRNYRDCALRAFQRAERFATEKGVGLDVVIALQKQTWEDEAALEQEQTEAKAELNTERHAALQRMPEALAPFRANGRWPRAKDIVEPLGLRPTRSNLGWIAYQLRLAAPTAQAAE